MTRRRSLRARIALSFAWAVMGAALFYVASAIAVFLLHEKEEEEQHASGVVEDEQQEAREVVLELLMGAAVVAPVAAAVAAGVGFWLAGKALAPLRDAADRARAARAGADEPLLPVLGADDDWDRLAGVVNDLLRDQRRSMERARSFSANAAHELRTPLTAVLGEVQVTLRRERSPHEYRNALKGVEAEVTRLAALVDVLLTLARADSGELRPELVAFDLSTVAAEAALAARGRYRRSDRVIHLETRPAPARGDPLLARRVLENLIENAVRHAARSVEVRVAVQGEVAVASVTDDGPGFPPAVRARLFERFNREPGSSDGFGLGLAIAHALTAAQGGRIRLDDVAGPTRILLELPVAAGQRGPES